MRRESVAKRRLGVDDQYARSSVFESQRVPTVWESPISDLS
jgi:hypothetical protein